MKQLKWMALLWLILGALTMNGCKKDDATTSTPASTDQQEQITAEDESDASDEANRTWMDANVALAQSNFSSYRHGSMDESIEGGQVIVFNDQKKVHIKYDGKAHGFCGRIREGTVIVSLTNGATWADKGAVITITYEGFKAKRFCRGKTKMIQFSGTTTITNVTGGIACMMEPGDSIVYDVNGTASITFDLSRTSTWNVAHRLTFVKHEDFSKSFNSDGLGINGMVVWGTDRFGRSFEVAISQTIRRSSKCGYDEPTAGILAFSKLSSALTITYGVDKEGKPVVAQDCSAYGFQITWTNEGKVHTYVIPYH